MMEYSKGYTPKKRKTRNRQPKKILLINAEGKNKTEKNYFHSFVSDSLVVHFCSGNDTDPVNMVKKLVAEYQRYELGVGDFAACFVDSDFDEQKDKQLLEADRRLKDTKKKNIAMYVSGPCFEIWFLCHFGCPMRNYLSNKEVIADLVKKLGKYEKNDKNMAKILAGNESIAIENAKKLEEKCFAQGKKWHTVAFKNSTEVYKIFEKMIMNKA